jgi:hypothetical protein
MDGTLTGFIISLFPWEFKAAVDISTSLAQPMNYLLVVNHFSTFTWSYNITSVYATAGCDTK